MTLTPSRYVINSKLTKAWLCVQNLGNEEFMKGNFTEALDLYSRAISIND